MPEPTLLQKPIFNRHGQIVLSSWNRLEELVGLGDSNVVIDGEALSVADVVAVARHGIQTHISDSPKVTSRVDASVAFLTELLSQDQVFYGIRTGFGGSANTRSSETGQLQKALMQMQQCGILAGFQTEGASLNATHSSSPDRISPLPCGEQLSVTSMPEAWVRAAMVVRCNTLVRGHSAVRYSIIESLATLLNKDYVPLVPLRGSISASGDLSPLSYIAGVLEGNPRLSLWTGDGKNGPRMLISADKILQELQKTPVTFGPKEALGLVNGTAVSAAVGALALSETNQLTVLSQVLTAMGVEALRGTIESFNWYLANVRPHEGQMECARNIHQFLQGSHLARGVTSLETSLDNSDVLAQDRYSLRTSSQWIGPLLEDLALAHQQITVELNSTTDNPIINVEGKQVLHGGNFQAVAVTSAMEKARSALQMMGKMLFAQCTEIINPTLSNGLPPNLAFDEPSLSYTMKGVDICMAAYTSELGFLNHSLGPHVQSAEIANQAINSLALISARYTHSAIDVFSMLAASYLYVLCQALDLRVIQIQYFENLIQPLSLLITKSFAAKLSPKTLQELRSRTWKHITQQFSSTTIKDSDDRFQHIAESTQSVLVTFFKEEGSQSINLSDIHQWTSEAAKIMNMTFAETRKLMVSKPETPKYLGMASKAMYIYVRQTLGIPLNQGLVDHPSVEANPESNGVKDSKQLIGDNISQIYVAIRSGELMVPVMECLAMAMDSSDKVH